MIRKGKNIDFNDKKLENIKFVEVSYQLAIDSHLTPKVYLGKARDEILIDWQSQDNDFSHFYRN